MFKLINASSAIKKAAARKGIVSHRRNAKFSPKYPKTTGSALDWGQVIAVVFDDAHPDGVPITRGEEDAALDYTWKEIRAGE